MLDLLLDSYSSSDTAQFAKPSYMSPPPKLGVAVCRVLVVARAVRLTDGAGSGVVIGVWGMWALLRAMV
ncbi:MAG: hypothetical protein KGP12_05890 [Actinomycetales bacterium]|nr:hypothetical protein [Actinomycetales bacterium]